MTNTDERIYVKPDIYIPKLGTELIPCKMYINLSVFSDEKDFNPNKLTQILQIEPTATWHKDDMIRKNLYRKETCWSLKTSRIETFDFEEVFKVLMNILDGKAEILAKYAKENNLYVKIVPVIVVSNNMPWITITKEIAENLLLLNAIMEFDMYFA
jgi:hypothetical protein